MSELVFRGRENEIEELLDFVKTEAGGTFIVCGKMGMGKSRILQELAIEIGENSHWLHFFELPEKTSVDALFPLWIERALSGKGLFYQSQKSRFIKFFGEIPYARPFIKAWNEKASKPPHFLFLEMLEIVSSALKKGRRCVILLDPDKEIADDDGAGNLKYILKHVPLRVKIIVAQRPADRLMGDAVFLAEKGIEQFHAGNIEKLTAETIKQILRESTQDTDVELNEEGIARLAERIDGWPYAAELYMRWAAMCLAEGRLEDACTTPPSVQAVVQELYEKCKGNARTVADWLTASKTPLTIKEISTISGLSGQAVGEALENVNLRRLVKISSAGAKTYEIFHRDLKDHIGRSLTERGDLPPMKKQLGAHYAALLESPDKEEQNLSLTHTAGYLLEAGDKRAFIEAVMAQWDPKYTSGLLAVCRNEMEQAQTWAKELKLDLKTISFFLGNLGLVYRHLGDLKKAAQYHEQALAIDREIGDRQGEAADLGNLGLVYQNLGELEKAAQYHEQALAIHRELGVRQGEAQNLGNLGIVYANLGEFKKAAEHHEQALAIDREIGDRQGEAADLGNLGVVYQDLGELDKATQYHKQALEIHRELGVRQGEAQNLGNLGLVYQNLGDFKKAAEHHVQALAIDREIGDRQGEAQDLGNLGLVYQDLGELDKAAQHHVQALAIDREIGFRLGEASDLAYLGSVYARQGDKEKALTYAREGLAIAEQIGAPPLIEEIKGIIERIEKQ
ncbi:MAG TPA: tetratricopeptide repeat protein [bacterium]|nr:tetratricopeptide repeat protein [bacterium]